jgi:hypothetical protein
MSADDHLVVSAIDHAYATHVCKLFEILCSSLTSESDSQEPLQRFAAGLALAARARELALGMVKN